MANKFWVGGGTNTNWNASPTTNWANSSGGAGNQTAPTTGDAVFFDANSGTGAAVWNTSISLIGLDCTSSKNPITHSNSVTITLTAGNLVFPTGVGGSYTAATVSTSFVFTSTGTTLITTHGGQPGSFQFNGSGGTCQLQDALTMFPSVSSTITLSQGTFDIQSFNVSTGLFVSNSASFPRTLTGSGSITVGASNASATIWDVAVGNLTISGFTGNINVIGTTANTRSFQGSTIVYNSTVNLIIAANTGGGSFQILGTPTVGGFQVTAPNYIALTAATFTITNTPTFTGSSGNEIMFASNAIDTQRSMSVSSGTVNFSWAAFKDINFTGGATFTATKSFDLGHNSGITITAPSGGSGGSFSAGFF